MPRIERYEDNRAASFLRRGMYAEALACAVETENRLMPPGGSTVTSNIALLVRILLAKCLAQIHLGLHRDSRFSALRVHQIVGLYGRRTPEIEQTYDMLATCLEDLERMAAILTELDNLPNYQVQTEMNRGTLEFALEMTNRIAAELTNQATALMRRLCELIL